MREKKFLLANFYTLKVVIRYRYGTSSQSYRK